MYVSFSSVYCNIFNVFQHCAQTLLDFNGGASCVQIYVNQHDFFLNKVRDTADHNDDLLYVLRWLQSASYN